MAFSLPELPYSKDALAPHISTETLDFHYGKHHQGYLGKLNAAVEADSSLAGKSLEDLVKSAKGGLFNNAAQIWNHSFYWNCLSAGRRRRAQRKDHRERPSTTSWGSVRRIPGES